MLKMKVLTPQGVLLEKQVDEVRAPGALGQFGVLPGHKPFVSALHTGTVLWRAGVEQGTLQTEPGFFEVDAQGDVLILVQSATLTGSRL